MICIAVGNKKGGVGKSTLTVHLACELAHRGRQVRVYDTDEQGTVTNWCSRGSLPIDCVGNPIENADQAHGFIHRVKADPSEVVMIDLPPHTQEATQAAVAVCDLFIIPVTPSGADFTSTGKALALVRQGRELRNGAPRALLVPSRVDRRTAFGREIAESIRGFDEPVGPAIGQRSVFIDAFGMADWVGRMEPSSKAYEEIVALTTTIEELIEWPKAD